MSRYLRVLLAILLMAALFSAGCKSQGEQAAEQPSEQTAQEPVGGTSDASGKPVLMLGRSTMWGWFKSWGWDGTPESLPMKKNDYSLTYKEIASPPDIASSATKFMDEAPEGSVVFFKFCFDDFHGAEDAAAEFEDQKRWIDEVAKKAEERNQRLIIGNALPKVAMSTDPTLVAEHRKFNAWLEDYAANSGGKVRAYDFYSILAGSDGAIKANYATSADDSHPNNAAYSELDPSLFTLLGEVAQ